MPASLARLLAPTCDRRHPIGMGMITDWGSTASERGQWFPCDPRLDAPDDVLFRAVNIAAPPELVFRWLCQLRAAPYSYDLVDNFGRRSPRGLTPGLEQLEVGQRDEGRAGIAHDEGAAPHDDVRPARPRLDLQVHPLQRPRRLAQLPDAHRDVVDVHRRAPEIGRAHV